MKPLKKASIAIVLMTCLTIPLLSQGYFYPYYGKNKVVYDQFEWKQYKTENFDIYYYVDDIQTLKKVADMAESAYLKLSNAIKHEISARVPLIYYKTTTEFIQTNIVQVSEGVLGFAEPLLYRFVIRGDMPDKDLQELITHELTHIFESDLIYGAPGAAVYSLASPPGWAMEGYAEYNTDEWTMLSRMIVRDAVLNDRIPELTSRGNLASRYPLPRSADYEFGHALFDFIEHKYGKNSVREFWLAMKGTSLLKKQDAIKSAFQRNTKEFNFEFKKYLRERTKKFLLRETPEDYSIAIGPEFPFNQYYSAYSHAVSPSGDIIAAMTINARELDIDIILISTKSGGVIKNITKKPTTSYQQIKLEAEPSLGRALTWTPGGDHIAFFARAGKKHDLFFINVVTGKTDKRIQVELDQPSSPAFLPAGKDLLFAAYKDGVRDIFKLNLEDGSTTNMTEDPLFEKAPSVSRDGKFVVYSIQIDSHDKLFLSPIENLKNKTQLTFGEGNTITPEFSSDGKKVYFCGDAREAFNIYSVDLENGEQVRYTDVRTGNHLPYPLPNDPDRLVFTSFNKGAFQIFISALEGEVEKTVRPVLVKAGQEVKVFEPELSLDIAQDEIKPVKGLGKLYLMARPPIDTIVTTDGSIYGGSALTFSDLMANHYFSLTAYQVRSFRSYDFRYINRKRRLQYMVNAYQFSIFYYPAYAYLDPSFYNFLSYRDAIAVREISGATIGGYYPLNTYLRTEFSVSFQHYQEDFFDPYLFRSSGQQGNQAFGYFWNGNALSLNFSLVGETTRFSFYGPASGNTFRITFGQSLPIFESFLQTTSVQVDLRQYINIGNDFLFALRYYGFLSRGKNPYLSYYGGNNQVRSANYYNIIGTEGWFANIEFRFPLINSASSILGPVGPIRGVLFFDLTRSKVKGYPALQYRYAEDGSLKAFEALGSYGFGVEFIFLGLPVHLDFVKRVEIEDMSTPFRGDVVGGFMTKFWIGFDF